MPNNIVHFAVHADDVERAKGFYGSVFGWQFEDWGPPEFYRVRTGTEEDPGVRGALQKRRGQSADQPPMIGYECTIGVEDLDATAAAVEKHGGKVVMSKFQIPGVGWLIFFRDTEDNVVGAIRFDT